MNSAKSFPFWILKILAVLVIIGGIISSQREHAKSERKSLSEVAPFQNNIDLYLKKKSLASPNTPAKGKVIFVNDIPRKVDVFSGSEARHLLEPTRLPNTPSDVASVVLYRCEYIEIGRYTNGTTGSQEVCNFKVVDVRTGAWSEWGEFRGSMPPEKVSGRSVASDEKGGYAVRSFVAAGGLRSN